MKNQITFADVEYQSRKRISKREEFLNAMEEIIPWDRWASLIAPYYPSGNCGIPTRGIHTMLRMYLLQIWFNLSDEGVEDAIYDSYCMRTFWGIDFMKESVPDATTLLKFRHLLEEHDLGKAIFEDIKDALDKAGLIMHGGSIVMRIKSWNGCPGDWLAVSDACCLRRPTFFARAKKVGKETRSGETLSTGFPLRTPS